MHDIEKLKAAQETALREAVEANRIAAELPIMPKRVDFALDPVPWVSYDAGNLEEAVRIYQKYMPLPYVIARDSAFTMVCLESTVTRRNAKEQSSYRVDRELDGAPFFECSAGEGFSTNEMVFFTRAAGRNLRICVKLAFSEIHVRLRVRSYSRTPTERFEKVYPSVPGAFLLRWGYGDGCCRASYLFPDIDTFWTSMGTYGIYAEGTEA